MSATQHCPKCGCPLPHDAPRGLCPKCLVKAGFESQRQYAEMAATAPSPGSSGFEPPSVEELAKRFPQLEILELLGKGGMGAVYKARQPGLDRLVAVKILPPEVERDPSFAERFTREARTMARLNHPAIVAVHDFGHTNGLYYLVMEYVDGASLRQMLQAGSLRPDQALAIVAQICDALQYAHDQGVVHRDIKPENLLFDKSGRVKIADFGLAKLLAKAPAEVTLTQANQVMGTPHYMAPEQLQRPLDVDHRADIYSLGVVFYELLTGELPVGRFEPPSRKVEVDVRLDEIVLRTLEVRPERRYQAASQVRSDLENVSGGGRSNVGATAEVPPRNGGDKFDREEEGDDESISRKAVVGAVLLLPFLFAAGAVAIEHLTTTSFGGLEPTLFMTTPLAAVACLLGGMAVRDIRRRRAWGLPLAVFDLLALPLVFINAAIILFGLMGASAIADAALDPPDFARPSPEVSAAMDLKARRDRANEQLRIEQAFERRRERMIGNIGVLIALPLCLLVDWLIALRTWRSVAGTHASARRANAGIPTATGGPWIATEYPDRPKIIPVLGVCNFFVALALLAMGTIVLLPEDPSDRLRQLERAATPYLHVVEFYNRAMVPIYFISVGAFFVAALGLLFYQPWARKLSIAVCLFELALLAIEVPILVLDTVVPEFKLAYSAEYRELLGLESEHEAIAFAAGLVLLVTVVMVIMTVYLIAQIVILNRPRIRAAFAAGEPRPFSPVASPS